MSGVAAWFRQTRRTYFDNAASVRDYRVQLRGNRSVILFGIYLFILIAVAMTVYSESTSGGGSMSVVDAQRRLRDFYGIVTGLLGGIVSLVAPALTATSIVMERQRRSLDLIFSAPVTPKYYLVGKMLASFRYTWMLLVLALPVTAACVVLGGASWTDVLVTYLALSMQGLVFTAMALLMSTLSPKPVSAVVWSYACAIGYLIVTSMGAAAAAIGSYSSRTQEAPFFSAMNPFLLAYSVNTHTMVGTTAVPNWIFTVILSLLLCKLCLLGAGTLLSAQPARELRSLRLHFLFYLSALVMYAGWENTSTTVNAGRIVFWAIFPLLLVMPFLSTFGVDSERRYRPNGWFSAKHTLDGTPAGGLPYVLLLIFSCFLAAIAGEWFGQGRKPSAGTLSYMLYVTTFWGMFWAIGRYASSTFVGLRSARMLQFAAFVLIVFLPVPFLASLSSSSAYGSASSGWWDFYILRPFFVPTGTGEEIATVYGIIQLIVGALIGMAAERNVRRRLPPERLAHERTLASS
jgi:ABC-type transport system involved in multi-copper enzyme maturation permease subunit